MKIKNQFMLRKIDDTYMAIPVGGRAKELQGVVTLTETGFFLWQKMEQNITMNELVDAITSEFEIDEETAKDDILNFLEYLREEGWIDE